MSGINPLSREKKINRSIHISFEMALFAMTLILHVILALLPEGSLMTWFYTDDAFYYFQIARNVVTGNGITFDGINPASGFHPLWMLICLPVFTLARLDPILPLRALVLISASLTAGGGVLLYRLVRTIYPKFLAILAALLWVFYWPVHEVITQGGLEAGLNGFLIIALLYAMANKSDLPSTRKHLLWLGVLSALVMLARLDNIFIVCFAGLWIVFQQPGMRFLVFADMLTIFVSIFAALLLRVGPEQAGLYAHGAYAAIAISLVSLPACCHLARLYEPSPANSIIVIWLRSLAAAGLAFSITFGVCWVGTQLNILPHFPRTALVLAGILGTLLLMATRTILYLINKKQVQEPIQIRSLWREWLWRGTYFALPVLLLVGGYISWHFSTFGTPLPVSGQIKQWWGTLSDTIYEPDSYNFISVSGLDLGLCPTAQGSPAWGFTGSTIFFPVKLITRWLSVKTGLACSPLRFPVLLLYTALLGWLIIKGKDAVNAGIQSFALPVLIAAGLLQPFFYQASGYQHTRDWYWVIQIITGILFIILLVGSLLDLMRKHKPYIRVVQFTVISACLFILISFSATLFTVFPLNNNASPWSEPGIAFLEANTEPGSLIGMTGGGTTAYFIDDRTIVNMDGLANSVEYYDLMQNRQAYRLFDQIGLDYVFGNADILLNSDPYRWFFPNRLSPFSTFENDVLYRYVNP